MAYSAASDRARPGPAAITMMTRIPPDNVTLCLLVAIAFAVIGHGGIAVACLHGHGHGHGYGHGHGHGHDATHGHAEVVCAAQSFSACGAHTCDESSLRNADPKLPGLSHLSCRHHHGCSDSIHMRIATDRRSLARDTVMWPGGGQSPTVCVWRLDWSLGLTVHTPPPGDRFTQRHGPTIAPDELRRALSCTVLLI